MWLVLNKSLICVIMKNQQQRERFQRQVLSVNSFDDDALAEIPSWSSVYIRRPTRGTTLHDEWNGIGCHFG
jgi:hypothetical protein